jgi:hypothetical protein
MYTRKLTGKRERSEIVIAHRRKSGLDVDLDALDELRYSNFCGSAYDDWDGTSHRRLAMFLERTGLWIVELGGEDYEPLRRWRRTEDGVSYRPATCQSCGDMLMLSEVHKPAVDEWGNVKSEGEGVHSGVICKQCFEQSKLCLCSCCGNLVFEKYEECPVCYSDLD